MTIIMACNHCLFSIYFCEVCEDLIEYFFLSVLGVVISLNIDELWLRLSSLLGFLLWFEYRDISDFIISWLDRNISMPCKGRNHSFKLSYHELWENNSDQHLNNAILDRNSQNHNSKSVLVSPTGMPGNPYILLSGILFSCPCWWVVWF